MTKKLLLAGVVLLATSACGSNGAADDANQDIAPPADTTTTSAQSTPNGLHQKQIGETGGWGCPEPQGSGTCAVTFAITSIEKVECAYPEIHQLQDGHSVVRIDLDVSTTQELEEDWTNQLGTLFINQWSVTTPDGYTNNNLPDKTGCVPNVEQTSFLLPATKTRPTAVIEIPDDASALQLRPAGMEGGGWSWSLDGVIA